MSDQASFPTISQYQRGDQEGVCAVIAEVWREYGSSDTPDSEPDLQSIATTYQDGRGGFWVASVNGRVVGTVALKPAGAQTWTLKRMYVLAQFRGKKFGTGEMLLKCVTDAVQRGGGGAIYLGTPDFLKRAHRFYEKHGFSTVSKASLPPLVSTDPIDSIFYVLRVAASRE